MQVLFLVRLRHQPRIYVGLKMDYFFSPERCSHNKVEIHYESSERQLVFKTLNLNSRLISKKAGSFLISRIEEPQHLT